MASSINASTSGPGGVITTADNSGILNLQSGGNTVATINSSGLQVTTLNSSTVPTAAGTVMVSGNMPAFSYYQSSAQTLSSNTSTLIQFQTKDWDTANCFNNTGSTVTLNGLSVPAYSFCPNVAGYYQLTTSVTVGASYSGMQALFYKNGFNAKTGTNGSNTNTFGCLNSSVVLYLNGTGDYAQIYFTIAVGQSLGVGSQYTYFQGAMVRTA